MRRDGKIVARAATFRLATQDARKRRPTASAAVWTVADPNRRVVIDQ